MTKTAFAWPTVRFVDSPACQKLYSFQYNCVEQKVLRSDCHPPERKERKASNNLIDYL